MMRWPIAAAAVLVNLVVAATPALAASVDGNWLTEEKNAIVQISPCGNGQLCGRLAWVEIKPADDNPQATDGRDPSPELRNRPLCGLTIMWGFRADGTDHWSDGAIYDPQSGKTYRAEMTLRSDATLAVRGYVLVSLLGRSEAWTRFTQLVPHCPAMVPDPPR